MACEAIDARSTLSPGPVPSGPYREDIDMSDNMSDNHPVEQPTASDPEVTPPYAGGGLLDGAEADAETDAEGGPEHGAEPGPEEGAENGEAARAPSHPVFADPENPVAPPGHPSGERLDYGNLYINPDNPAA